MAAPLVAEAVSRALRNVGDDTFSWDNLYLDVSTAPDTGYGYFQLFMLLIIYFSLLWLGSFLIVSGTELLIFLPGMSSIVGSIILPVLGQFPMILLSIFAGFGAEAQTELEVGVGALAGGIVGQVSIYGYLTILLGAVNVDPITGLTDYSKVSKKKATTSYAEYWLFSGIKSGKYTSVSTIYALVTAFPFVVLLIPNIIYADVRTSALVRNEQPYDIFAFVFAYLLFLVFMFNQYIIMSSNDDLPYFDVKEQLMSDSVRRKLASLMSVLSKEVHDAEEEEEENTAARNRTLSSSSAIPTPPSPDSSPNNLDEQSRLVADNKPKTARMRQLKNKLQRIITPFLSAEVVHSQTITLSDLMQLFHDLGEKHITLAQLIKIFNSYLQKPSGESDSGEESDNFSSGGTNTRSNLSKLLGAIEPSSLVKNQERLAAQTLSINNVLDGLARFLTHYKEFHEEGTGEEANGSARDQSNTLEHTLEDMGEFPHDLNELSNEDQQYYLRVRASILLTCGLLLSIYAVDPIILTMDEIATRLGISAYYIAFIIVGGVDVPTILAVVRYATKRSERTASICQDTILGSVITLNTLGLGTFMAVVYSQGLAWEYLAEGTAILTSLVLASVLYFKDVMTMLDGVLLLLLFPMALGIVAIMSHYGYT